MAITIVPKEKQANGQFNGGAILEKKPIGFPQDGGGVTVVPVVNDLHQDGGVEQW